MVDIARKVVGVGSVGTRAWIVLMLGRDDRIRCSCSSRRRKPRCWKSSPAKSEFDNHGERVVAGQHLMQASSDIFLGLASRRPRHRRSAARLLRTPAEGLERLLRDEGALPEGHGDLRPGVRLDAGARPRPLGRSDRDCLVSRSSDVFDRAIADFSEAYADQNERDYTHPPTGGRTRRVEARIGSNRERPRHHSVLASVKCQSHTATMSHLPSRPNRKAAVAEPSEQSSSTISRMESNVRARA